VSGGIRTRCCDFFCPPSTPDPLRVDSAVPDFLAFWEIAAAEPREVQRRLWHELYEQPNRDLFDLYYTNWASPDGLDGALERLPGEIQTIEARAADLPQRITAAARATADFLEQPLPDLEVQLLVGLFSSDGWVTDFRGRRTLFMAVEYLPPYDAVFLAHECAHLVHGAAGFEGDTVAAAVVAEGLAVAVSAELEPGHDEAVYLWMRDGREEWLAGCVAREEELRARLRADLDSEDPDVYARWFLGRPNESGLPARSGYFVARRWVDELGVPFRDLVSWDYQRARAALDSPA
jgi:hypothetical protein